MRSAEWPPLHPTVEDLLAAAIDHRRVDGRQEPSAYAWDTAAALLHEFAGDLQVLYDARRAEAKARAQARGVTIHVDPTPGACRSCGGVP